MDDRNAKILYKALSEIRTVLGNLQGGISKQQLSEILALVTLHLEKPKGDKGDAPTKEELVELITPLIPEPIPGVTPKKGEDYFTEEDIRGLIAEIVPLIHTPKRGEDYWNEHDQKAIIEEAVKLVLAGVEPHTTLKEEEWEKIKALIEEAAPKIDASFIKGIGLNTITVGPTAPSKPQEGDLWVDTRAI